MDISGNVFISDSYMGVIQVFNIEGEFKAVVCDFTDEKTKKFITPVGLCLDNNKRLYVVEMLANRVGVYKIGSKG